MAAVVGGNNTTAASTVTAADDGDCSSLSGSTDDDFVRELQNLFHTGVYAQCFRDGGLNTCIKRLSIDEEDDEMCHSKFSVTVNPFDDLWITSPVTFEVMLSSDFPQDRPKVKCTSIDEAIRSDPRLVMLVENVATEPAVFVDSSDEESEGNEIKQEEPKIYKSRIDLDGSVNTNLLTSRYMGWLELYPLEVLVHTLRLLFQKTNTELAPSMKRYIRHDPNPVSVESGVYIEKGMRKTMEDRVSVEDFKYIPMESVSGQKVEDEGGLATESSFDENTSVEGRKVSLHAVYDGHGGHQAAEEASTLLEELFFLELTSIDMGIERALHNAVIAVEEKLAQDALAEKQRTGYILNTSGTTLCAVAIDLDQGVLYCANVGDSRAIMHRRDGSTIDLSQDHKATRPDEIARVVHTGGFVSYGRVLGMLAVSRALGDPEMKAPNPLVSSTPTITRFDLTKNDEFVLIASDGLYDVMASDVAAKYVKALLECHQDDLEQITIDVVKQAIGQLRSQDNVSVVLIKLKSNGEEEMEEVAYIQSDKVAVDEKKSPSYLSPKVQAAARASRIRKHNTSSDLQ